MDQATSLNFSEPMTLGHFAYAMGWPKGEARKRVRAYIERGEVVRRLVPISPTSRKRRVVYQRYVMKQSRLV